MDRAVEETNMIDFVNKHSAKSLCKKKENR